MSRVCTSFLFVRKQNLEEKGKLKKKESNPTNRMIFGMDLCPELCLLPETEYKKYSKT